MRSLLLLLAMTLLSGGSAAAQPGRLGQIVNGQPFPLVQLPELTTGKLKGLADWRGRRVVLHVFASW